MRRLHQLFDIYNDYEGISNLKTVNDNAGLRPVRVEPDILELLELSKQAYADTGGAVNVAMGSVLRIWHEYRTAGEALPATRELRAASLHTDIDDVVIDRQNATVFLADSGLSLDVGAVAKGYAAQKAIDKAVAAGLTSGILNAGGNICVVGSPGDGRENWSVGIQAPQLTEGNVQEIIDTVYLSGPAAVVTSGDYQRFYTVDDVAYHHIIDPQTLFPARNAKAVTVIHPDSAMADVLSTAVFILPYEQGLALVRRMGAEALWLWEDGTETATDGYRALAKSGGAG